MEDVSFKKLKNSISSAEGFIQYTAIGDEVEFAHCPLFLNIKKDSIVLPSDTQTDPFLCAEECIQYFLNKNVCIVIPGRMFDRKGTRYGRGGGWYDRFLSRVPESWIRIGVTDSSHFSNKVLVKNKWDQSVDWLILSKNNDWIVFETKARIKA